MSGSILVLPRTRGAALVSRHGPTCRRVAQSLGAAGLQVRAAPFPHELPIGDLADVAAVLVDLDVAPNEPAAKLVGEARRAYPGVDIMAMAGIDARVRMIDALCQADVSHVLPKRGALTLPRGGVPVLGSLEGPDEHDLFAAIRRLLVGPDSPGVTPYLLSGAPVHEAQVRSTEDKDAAHQSDRQLRRVDGSDGREAASRGVGDRRAADERALRRAAERDRAAAQRAPRPAALRWRWAPTRAGDAALRLRRADAGDRGGRSVPAR